MNLDITIKRLKGEELAPHIDALAHLRIEIFKDYPYLYEGNLTYEKKYLDTYLLCPESIMIVALDHNQVIGASTAIPLMFETEECKQPFIKNNLAIQKIFYFGESVLKHAYRGKNIYRHFFNEREKAAKEYGAKIAAFCAVDRAFDDPRRPNAYQPLDEVWQHLGYKKHPELVTYYEWKEVGDPAYYKETARILVEGLMITIATTQYQIQTLVSWDDYLKKMTNLVQSAKEKNAELLLLPEYAGLEIGFKSPNDEALYKHIQNQLQDYLTLLSSLATTHNIYIQSGTIPVLADEKKYYNRAYLFSPQGDIGYQDKLQLTEFEKQSALITQGHQQTIFNTAIGKIGIAICYDSEFPEIVRNLTLQGATLILVPSYTTTIAGFHRVSLSCRARALENHCYVANAFTVGAITLTEPHENTIGKAALYGPVEAGFSDNGIIAETATYTSCLITASFNHDKLTELRKSGDVHNYDDFIQLSRSTLPSVTEVTM